MRRIGPVIGCLALVVAGLSTLAVPPAGAEDVQEYVVLYRAGVSPVAAQRAVAAAGGTVVKENLAVGVATVRSSNPRFLADAAGQAALEGAARSRPIGSAPPMTSPKLDEVERAEREREEATGAPGTTAEAEGEGSLQAAPAPGAEPLAHLQWNMAMIRATATESHAVQRGDKRVLVGIIDTGIDGNHPDIAPNFSRALSRNFTTDVPLVDGSCEAEPDRSCSDPNDVDDSGHGTHVAGIVGAAINGLGIAGVAPNITLVNLRAGQDSGFFFLQSTVDALTYAGDNAIDVVNMSFYTDPWLFNCAANPADSPAEQMEQRTIVAATQRALDYAYNRGVTLVGSLGNEHTDLGRPETDIISPNFPPGIDKSRTVDNSCLVIPVEGRHVIGVSSIGPSKTKADYSNYGLEQTDVSAPGGYFRDRRNTPDFRSVENLVLSTYPEALAAHVVDQNGVPVTPFVVRDCQQGVCAYYQYLEGTSMAAPHATGVAALIVSQYGYPDVRRGGLTLHPATTEALLKGTATPHPCPEPRLLMYSPLNRPSVFDALCLGPARWNGFYGRGIVDALSAVTGRPRV